SALRCSHPAEFLAVGRHRRLKIELLEQPSSMLPDCTEAVRRFGSKSTRGPEFGDHLGGERHVGGGLQTADTYDVPLVVDVDELGEDLVEDVGVDDSNGLKPTPQIERAEAEPESIDLDRAGLLSRVE